MTPVIAIIVVLLVGAVVLVVSAPLRRARSVEARGEQHGAAPSRAPVPGPARDELEAARESKYREIRDCELDYRTGKLSLEDYQATDAQLRAEAFEILNRLEALTRG